MARPEVVSMAAVSNLGSSWDCTWQALLRGESSSHPSEVFGVELKLETAVAGISNLDRTITTDGLGAASRLGKLVAEQLPKTANHVRCYGASNHSEADILGYLSRTLYAPSSLWLALLTDPMPDHVFDRHASWTYSACTSSMHALLAAILDFSEDSQASEAIVVGADALSAIEIAGFKRLGATSNRGCKPFHSEATGILIGEGAAAILLRHPVQEIGCIRILGIGTSCDAHHATDPDPEGIWLERCVRESIARAGLEPKDIAAVVAHGTGTAKNDTAELNTYSRIWPSSSNPIISVKGGIGHTMGASGLMNVLVAIEVSRSGTLPPMPGQYCPPKSIPKGAPVLAVASGFGGNNCSCVVGAAR